MAFVSRIRIVMRGVQGGENCYNEFEYIRDSLPSSTVNSVNAATAFVTDTWPALRALLSNQYRLVEVEAQYYQNPSSGSTPAYILAVDEPGDVDDSEALPPDLVVMIQKVPNNAAKDPVSEPDLGVGRARFSGIPESQQNNGLLTSAAFDDWNTAAEALEELTVPTGGGGSTYTWGIPRKTAAGIVIAWAPVLEVQAINKTRRIRSRQR